jgi:ankyrin repeat protein
VKEGHEAVVQQLLVTGKVDIDSKDKDGRTPLLWAVKEGHEAVVQRLLATGKADVNSKDNYGWTPLSLARKNSHENIIKLLAPLSIMGGGTQPYPQSID